MTSFSQRAAQTLAAASLGLVLSLAAPVQAQQAPLPVAKLTAGMHVITAEVAADQASRQQGLMFREKLPPNRGMLFVFEQKAGHCFWMRNTPLPLSIAFLADDGTIVNIEDMQARTEDNHCPKAAVRYALEMEKGWFKQKGLKAGAQIKGLPQLQ